MANSKIPPENGDTNRLAPENYLPCVPLLHPFVERLIGTIRRELLDQAIS